MRDVFNLYQRKVALLSSAQKEKLQFINDEGMSPFVMGCAILRAKQIQRRSREGGQDKQLSFNYIHQIMRNWLNRGIASEADFLKYWSSAGQEQKPKGRGMQIGRTEEKIRREDFTYQKPRQDKSLFSFLDE